MMQVLRTRWRDFIDTRRGVIAVSHVPGQWSAYEVTVPMAYSDKRVMGALYRHFDPNYKVKDEEQLIRVLTESEAVEAFSMPFLGLVGMDDFKYAEVAL